MEPLRQRFTVLLLVLVARYFVEFVFNLFTSLILAGFGSIHPRHLPFNSFIWFRKILLFFESVKKGVKYDNYFIPQLRLVYVSSV